MKKLLQSKILLFSFCVFLQGITAFCFASVCVRQMRWKRFRSPNLLENMVIIWPPIERLLVFVFSSTQQGTFPGTHAAAFLVSFSGAASTMCLLYYIITY